MADISNIRLDGVEYALKDARIVSGYFAYRTTDVFTFSASMAVVFIACDNCVYCVCNDDHVSWQDHEPSWCSVNAFGDGTYEIRPEEAETWYTAIIIGGTQ